MRTSLLVLSLLPAVSFAAEGMWLFDAVPTAAIERETGVKVTPEQLDRLRLGAARLSTGCSASFVSPQGLVLTNHHCVRGCISQLSGPGRDLLARGFTARRPAQELKCSGVDVQQLVSIEDVTAKVTAATQGKEGKALSEALRTVRSGLEAPCSPDAKQRCELVTLYGGGRYHLYTYRRYADVRLAWAPEFSMAAFGGYADNFNFPRFGMDAALLRVWEDGKPAQTPQALSWARAPLKDGDVAFVAGHPGGTERQVTLAELRFQRDVVLPETTVRLAELRGLLFGYRERNPSERALLDAELRSVENGLKALGGRHQALGDPAFFARLEEAEAGLRTRIEKSPKVAARTRGAWDEVGSALSTYRSFRDEHLLFGNAQAFPGTLFQHARHLLRAAVERDKPDALRLPGYTEAARPGLEARLSSDAKIHVELEILKLGYGLRKMREVLGAGHPLVQRVLGKDDPEALARKLVKTSELLKPEQRVALLKGGMAAVARSRDPLLALAAEVEQESRALSERYRSEVEAPIASASSRIAEARFVVDGTDSYPDATFTLRLSYGHVKGWTELGASSPVPALTTFGGAQARATGVAPYALPPTWTRAAKQIDPAIPFNVSTTHDIIGGNSGSPLLNAAGEVAGLVFDGNLHSLGGRYGYDAERNRAVSVHGDAIIHALRTIYGGGHLADELLPKASATTTAP